VAQEYPSSWYAATLGEVSRRVSLQSSHRCDTVVVGAGLAGLTTALECVRRGQSVIVLEANRVAWGASGRNGGMVISGFALELPELIHQIGQDRAMQLYRHSCDGLDYVRDQAQKLAPDVIMGEGLLSVSRYPAADEFRREAQQLKSQSVQPPVHWETERLRQVLATDRYYDALYDAASFHLHPLRYAHALATEFERLNGQIFEDSQVHQITLDDTSGEVCVHSADAMVSCRDVVLCTSAYDHKLWPEVSRAILPVATYVAVTEPLNEQQQPINTLASVIDTRRASDYYRRIDDERLLWGGKITTQPRVPANLQRIMQRTIAATYPQLSSVTIESCWSGLMGYALHKMPIIAQTTPHIWSATAFGGHGLNTTAMAGCLVAKAICEADDQWRDFADFKPRWAGGHIGRVLVQAGYRKMQLQDKWVEWRADRAAA